MDHCGVILKQLRLLNKFTIKEAAARIERGAGWLSEVENGKGNARLSRREFDRIVAVYGGEAHKKKFGLWVAKAKEQIGASAKDLYSGGPVLKYLRRKANKSLAAAARDAQISRCYLSYLENGRRSLPPAMRDKLMRIYGYSPNSFKNFASEDKRASNIPTKYKLNALLSQMDETSLAEVFKFARQFTKSRVNKDQKLQIESEAI